MKTARSFESSKSSAAPLRKSTKKKLFIFTAKKQNIGGRTFKDGRELKQLTKYRKRALPTGLS
jgi:hypothetical protein